jgi:hypothetical protein
MYDDCDGKSRPTSAALGSTSSLDRSFACGLQGHSSWESHSPANLCPLTKVGGYPSTASLGLITRPVVFNQNVGRGYLKSGPHISHSSSSILLFYIIIIIMTCY